MTTLTTFAVVYWKNTSKKRKYDGTLSYHRGSCSTRVRAILRNDEGKSIETEEINCNEATVGASIVLAEHRVELVDEFATEEVAASAGIKPEAAFGPVPTRFSSASKDTLSVRSASSSLSECGGHSTCRVGEAAPVGEFKTRLVAPHTQELLTRRVRGTPTIRTPRELLALLQGSQICGVALTTASAPDRFAPDGTATATLPSMDATATGMASEAIPASAVPVQVTPARLEHSSSAPSSCLQPECASSCCLQSDREVEPPPSTLPSRAGRFVAPRQDGTTLTHQHGKQSSLVGKDGNSVPTPMR